MEIQYKGKIIHPYESFYWNTTESFNRGELGGGICRCIKTDDSLATLVMEEVKIIKEGNYHKSGHNASSIVNVNGSSPTVMENHGTITAIVEPKIIQKFGDRGTSQYSIRDIAHTIPSNPMSDRGQMLLEPTINNPLKDKTNNGWHFEQQVYDENGITRAIKAGGGSGNIPKVIEDDKNFFYKGDKVSSYDRVWKTDCGTLNCTKQMEILEEQKEVEYRIRKLTPRECFRLMGVEDKDIDKIQNAGISNSQQYKLAGNSIVVDVLYHLFRKMFIEKESESNELTLF